MVKSCCVSVNLWYRLAQISQSNYCLLNITLNLFLHCLTRFQVNYYSFIRWVHGGLMVSGLVSGSSSLGSSTGQYILLPECLSSPRCINWLPANLMLGVTLQWTVTEISSGLMGLLVLTQTIPFFTLERKVPAEIKRP